MNPFLINNKIIVTSILLLFFSFTVTANPTAKKGIIDLRNYDFSEKKAINLDGEWEFYWKRLLSPEDFQKKTLKKKHFIKVPASWKNYTINDTTLSHFGYATYRIVVLTNNSAQNLKLHTNSISSASKVFINGVEIASTGQVGKSRETMKAQYPFKSQTFSCDNNKLEIIVQVSNYHIHRSGLAFPVKLGKYEYIERNQKKDRYKNIILIGSFLIMFFYHLILFLWNRKEKSALYFSLACISLSVYILYMSKLFPFYFPEISFETGYTLMRTFLFLAIPSFIMFIYSMFPSDFPRLMLKSLVGIFLIFTLIVLIFDISLHTRITLISRLLILFSSIVTLLVVIKATIKKREDSKVFLIGFVIFILTVFNDVLYRMEIFHNTTDLIEVGLFLFIFSQAYILSSRRSRAYNRLEKLSVKLKTMNENLEDIVKERTEEIETQKEEIALQRDYAEKQKNIIRQQISEIKISFNYALKIQTAAMPKRELLDKMFPNNFILFKPKDIVSGDFYWFKTIEQNNRKVHVVTAADCTGHGVPGAFVSMLGIAFLNEIAQKPELNTPAKILGALREKFRQELKENENAETSSIDMALCMIDNDKKELQFAGAYNPLFIVRNNKLIEIKSTKRPVGSGKFSEKQFYNNTVVLEKNDRLFLFSDGFSDQLGGNKKKKFMKKSFKELLIETSNHPIQKQKEILASEFKEWKGNNEQTDDILIIGIHI